ncbi:MAG TPA: phosphoenolpyruvate synthase [archaeon]|nr:phosphoenolpyruvate synthase [archaeon]
MQYTLNLEEIDKSSQLLVGSKASNLGDLIKASIVVPQGFVVTTDAFKTHIRNNQLEDKIKSVLENLDFESPQKLEERSREIESLILECEMPEFVKNYIREAYDELSFGKEPNMSKQALDIIRAGRSRAFVAVRSSATIEDQEAASFAGQFTSYLNIVGFDKLLEAIKRSWASIYSPRAIFYRNKNKIQEPQIAVIIQKMLDSEKSGVIFTADPTTNNRDRKLIEASWGLCQPIVSGLVTPDLYVLDKPTGQILGKKINRKKLLFKKDQIGKTVIETVSSEKQEAPVLSDTDLTKLHEYSNRIEDVFGKPQDIEWCIERGRLFILQSRPITTISKNIVIQESTGEVLLTGCPASSGLAKSKTKILKSLEDLSTVQPGDIIVSRVTNPAFTPYLGKIAGIITDEGGVTSHTAIVCREFGIPFIVGAGNATQVLQDNQEITIDSMGKIYTLKPESLQPTVETVLEPQTQQVVEREQEDFTATQIKVSLAFPFDQNIQGVDGVGLLGLEHFLKSQNPTYLAKENPEELILSLVNNIGNIARQFQPKQVCYRSLDIQTNEFENQDDEPKEANPLLGWHGVRRSLEQQEVLECELAAIQRLNREGVTNIAYLLPFVLNVEDVRKVKQLVTFPLKIGISVEIPATALNIENFCKDGVDFVSINLNNLAQLTLGVDRENPNTSGLYSESHPSIISLLKQTISTCKTHGVKTNIVCAGLLNTPELVERLVEFGIDSISVEPESVKEIKTLVSRAERKLLLEKARTTSQS